MDNQKINPVSAMLDISTREYIATNGRDAFIKMIEKFPAKRRAQYNQALTRWEHKYRTFAGEYGLYPRRAIDDAEEIIKGKI